MGFEVLGGDGDNAIRRDGEGHFDLHFPSWGGSQAIQHELSKEFVVLGSWGFSLQDEDIDLGLFVFDGGEDVAMGTWDRGVLFDEDLVKTSCDHDPEGVGGDVKEKNIVVFFGEGGGLDGGAKSDDFVRMDAAVGGLFKELSDSFLDFGNPCHAADEDDFIDFFWGGLGVLEGFLADLEGSVDEVSGEGLEFFSRESFLEVVGLALWVGEEKGKVNLCGGGSGKFVFGGFSGFFEALEGHLVFAQIELVFLWRIQTRAIP